MMGFRKSAKLLNRLSMPFSAGVMNCGFVKIKTSRKDALLVRKLETVYNPTDRRALCLRNKLNFSNRGMQKNSRRKNNKKEGQCRRTYVNIRSK